MQKFTREYLEEFDELSTICQISPSKFYIIVRKASLDAQEMKSISFLDNVATLMHFLFTQTKQQYIVRPVFING